MRITELSLKRPVTTLMLFFCFLVVGGVATRLLPLEYFPEVQFPGIFIQIPYPSSSPEEVERLVTRPVEEALATLSGIKRFRSDTNNDGVQIGVFFGWDANAIVKGIEAREKIDAIRDQLPSDLQRLFVFTGRTTDAPMLEIRISSDSRDLSKAYDLLDRKLRRAIESVPGVSKVDLGGVEPLQIEIQLDAGRVAAHGVQLPALAATLAKHNFSVSGGLIQDAGQRLRVKPVGEWQKLDDIRELPINDRGLRLSDIATVTFAHPPREVGRHLDLKDAIALSITRESGANLVDTSERVMQRIQELSNSNEFRGIQLYMMNNQAEGVVNSLKEIVISGLIGFALSVLVLYSFMRNWPVTIAVSLAVPFAVMITLAYMFFAGVTINILSMMGLMLSIGMLVDNAVVVSESIFRQEPLYPNDRKAAILAGARHVGLAVLTGTITTVIVFLPNIIGEKIDVTVFLSHVATTITVSMFASLFISLTIIPLLLYWLPMQANAKPVQWVVKLSERYANILDWTLHHPKLSGLFALLVLLSVAIPFNLIKKDMFEESAQDRLRLFYQLDGKYTVDRVEAAVTPLEEWLLKNKDRFDIDSVYSYFVTDEAGTTILLKKERPSGLTLQEMREQMEKEMPKFPLGKVTFQRDRFGGGEDLRVLLVGDSTERLAGLSRELAQMLAGVKGLKEVRSEANRGDQEVQVRIDRSRAQVLGLTPSAVAQSVAVAMRGQPLRTMRTAHGETDVRLMFGKSDRQKISDLETLPLFRPNGERIPLSAVADITTARASQRIVREDRLTTIGVTAVADGISGEEARKKIEPFLSKLQLPPGYSASFGGGFDREDEAGRVFAQNMLLALMMIYVVMAAMFESLIFPSAVIFSVFYSVVGVFWFFLITGTTLSIMANIGILVLMGVIVNNGIVLIDHINQLRKEGIARAEAILTAGRERLRPILMTTATTVLGLVPLCMGSTTIGGDADSPPYYPMARAVVGGLVFSTVVSLLILPTIYVGLDNIRLWSSRVWAEAKARARGQWPAPMESVTPIIDESRTATADESQP
ncbi:efflux RND transporter permease subunit [Permianibacter sp. IMCC34836]|uniref:efflux RND transporter permease subunit n=1 Tax=Permianibacter fluminis TaxID=2738515 RepID=UPI00155228E3|nr:efflux RND transporter permease subunit [Permianibacter fluminis]NQD37552.1 efflux RND transporter permease subunit [Permianibacter fluminis]